MTEDNDWVKNVRQANYYLVDTYPGLIGADKSMPEKLRTNRWSHCRIIRINEMRRETTVERYIKMEKSILLKQLM